MLLFCRNCGKELVVTPTKSCSNCGAHPVKASAFCRYCGHTTSAEDVVCPTCGAAIKPIPSRLKDLAKENQRLARLGKILNLSIVITIVTLYVVFSLPPTVTKPIKSAASDLVVATVGYTPLPLDSISASPFGIPMLALATAPRNIIGETITVIFAVNATQQLTIYALYKNMTTNTNTGTARIEDVTTKCTFQSSNDKIATVTSGGLVQGVAVGSANITAFYTAAPGSADLSAATAGKIPMTVSVMIPVVVGVTFTVR